MTEQLIHSKDIVLTEEQDAAVNSMIEWAHKPFVKDTYKESDLFFLLTGSAGTGKSTVTKTFLNKLNPYIKTNTVVTAPTHKAKKVISKMSGLQAVTLQKLLGMKPNTDIENFDINKVQFDTKGEPEINGKTIIIIDETSMVNKDLQKLLVEKATMFKVKVLYIGDALQIPPVNEVISLTLEFPQNKYELTQVIRQKDTNPLGSLLEACRDDILLDTETVFDILKETPININEETGEGYEVMPLEEFKAKTLALYNSDEFRADKDYVKVVSYMNKVVFNWNQLIRNHINGFKDEEGTKNPLIQSDLLMAYNTVTTTNFLGKINDNVLINSEDYRIKTIAKAEKNGIPGFEVKLEAIDYFKISNTFIVDPNYEGEFVKAIGKYLNIAKKYGGRKWIEYYAFKNDHLLIKDIRDRDDKILFKKDLDYAYAITCHKTQGSTYKNVCVNLENILSCQSDVERKKLAYVALSRTSHKNYINLTL